jgi:hypothetical protein
VSLTPIRKSSKMSDHCAACRGQALSFFGRRLSYSYYLCDGCGTLQLSPMSSEADLRKAYASASEYAASPDAMHDGGSLEPVIINRDHERYHPGIVDAVKAVGVTCPILEVGSVLVVPASRHCVPVFPGKALSCLNKPWITANEPDCL